MKKYNKLQINSEKLMKDEELMTLRGGYDNCCICWNLGVYVGPANWSECDAACREIQSVGIWNCLV